MSAANPEQITRRWLDRIVVGLNLCPFAGPVIRQNAVQIEVCNSQDLDAQLAAVLQQLDHLQQCDEQDLATSLLVFSEGLRDFDHYWDFVGLANELLEPIGLAGTIQIASFHPAYRFDGVAAEDVSHYTNRSPYPMLHFIREAHLSRVLQSWPQPEQIPANNIRRLQQLGKQALLTMLDDLQQP